MSREELLVDAAGLAAELASPNPPLLLDIRFSPAGPDLRPEYEAGHLPGAHFIDLQTQLSRPGGGTEGRRPLPTPEALQATLRELGVHDGTRVVVYDNNNGLTAGRAWWVLTWAGLAGVRLLDGGYAAWVASGGEVSTAVPELPGGGTFTVVPGGLPTIDIDEAQEFPQKGILLDARGPNAYVGGPAEPGQPPTGHIPGALDGSTRASLDDTGRVLDDAALRARFASLGVTGDQPVAAYCGGGVAAAHQVFTLKLAGIDAALFVGSWSAWSSDPSRPVVTGEHPYAAEHATVDA